jgi:hypothetical protein
VLYRPVSGGVGGDAGDMQVPGAVFEERQRVQPLAEDGVEMKKSAARMSLAWFVRNSRQVGLVRRGAGSMPAAWRISDTVDAAIGCPRRPSSPWIRLWLHRAFSRASRRTSCLSAALVGGRPVRARRVL